MAKLRAWVQAARPLAFGNIGLPVVFGAALAANALDRELALGGLSWALVWGALDQLCIVFANDVADEQLDRGQAAGTLVSGGSRVLVEGKLDASALRRAAALSALALCTFSVFGSWRWQAWLLPSCAAAALALLWAYSFAPLRRSYKSGGAGLQALGMGLVLPLVGWQLQGASLGELMTAEVAGRPAVWAFAPGILLAWCGNWLTALPDLESDRAGGKQTRPVRVGPGRTAYEASVLTLAAGALVWGLHPDWSFLPNALIVLALLLLGAHRLGRREGESILGFVITSLFATTWVWLFSIAALLRTNS